MDNLQYLVMDFPMHKVYISFKPCYKWITSNTMEKLKDYQHYDNYRFKPCYKWITFNTLQVCYMNQI